MLSSRAARMEATSSRLESAALYALTAASRAPYPPERSASARSGLQATSFDQHLFEEGDVVGLGGAAHARAAPTRVVGHAD